MKKTLLSIFFLAFLGMTVRPCAAEIRPQPSSHDLVFRSPAKSWDEAVPLGNGMVGALVWQKDAKLRLSLDRADLWDLRPVPNLSAPEWKFRWVVEQSRDEPSRRKWTPGKARGPGRRPKNRCRTAVDIDDCPAAGYFDILKRASSNLELVEIFT